MKKGQKVILEIDHLEKQEYTIKCIGPYTVKLVDQEGNIHMAKKSKIKFQLYGPEKFHRRLKSSVYAISTPMGGQPDKKKRDVKE